MEQLNDLGLFLVNHWTLGLALFAILLLIFANEFLAQKKRAKEISPAKVIELINNEQASVFDLRDSESFRAGHITDSIRVSSEDFDSKRMEKYKNKTHHPSLCAWLAIRDDR